jgi:hypothetical protein
MVKVKVKVKKERPKKGILKKPSSILCKKNAWTQHRFAASKTGRMVSLYSRSAVCFCAVGAIRKALPLDKRFEFEDQMIKLVNSRRKIHFSFLSEWNDRGNRTFKQVRDMLKKTEKKLGWWK